MLFLSAERIYLATVSTYQQRLATENRDLGRPRRCKTNTRTRSTTNPIMLDGPVEYLLDVAWLLELALVDNVVVW